MGGDNGEAVAGALADLRSRDADARSRAVRCVKNAVIGSRTRKEAYVDADVVPLLIEILNNHQDEPALANHAASALCSISFAFDKGASRVVSCGGLQSLIAALGSEFRPLFDCCLRALFVLYTTTSMKLEINELFIEGNHSSRAVLMLLRQMQDSEDNISDICAKLLVHACDNDEHRQELIRFGALEAAASVLKDERRHVNCRVSALELIADITNGSKNECARALEADIVGACTSLMAKWEPSLRLHACRFMANAVHLGAYMPHDSAAINAAPKMIIEAMLRLLDDGDKPYKVAASSMLAMLVRESEAMQWLAYEARAVEKLSRSVQWQALDVIDDVVDQGVDALAALSSQHETIRTAIFDCEVVPKLVEMLRAERTSSRASAVRCVRSLSRTVANANVAGQSLSTVAVALFQNIQDPRQRELRAISLAAMCNLVLDNSQLRGSDVDRDIMYALVALSDDAELSVAVNALWALKNRMYRATLESKKLVMEKMTFAKLQTLLQHPKVPVREQAIALVRNLSIAHTSPAHAEDINYLLEGFGANFVPFLQGVLTSGSDVLVVEALYTVSNVAAGKEQHKELMMSAPLLRQVFAQTHSTDPRARVAAIVCAINFVWNDLPEPKTSVLQRGRTLVELGFLRRMREMLRDPHMEVICRVQEALRSRVWGVLRKAQSIAGSSAPQSSIVETAESDSRVTALISLEPSALVASDNENSTSAGEGADAAVCENEQGSEAYSLTIARSNRADAGDVSDDDSYTLPSPYNDPATPP